MYHYVSCIMYHVSYVCMISYVHRRRRGYYKNMNSTGFPKATWLLEMASSNSGPSESPIRSSTAQFHIRWLDGKTLGVYLLLASLMKIFTCHDFANAHHDQK